MPEREKSPFHFDLSERDIAWLDLLNTLDREFRTAARHALQLPAHLLMKIHGETTDAPSNTE